MKTLILCLTFLLSFSLHAQDEKSGDSSVKNPVLQNMLNSCGESYTSLWNAVEIGHKDKIMASAVNSIGDDKKTARAVTDCLRLKWAYRHGKQQPAEFYDDLYSVVKELEKKYNLNSIKK